MSTTWPRAVSMITGVVDAALPEIAADVEAARAGKHDVEQDDVPGFAGRAIEAGRTVGRRADFVAVAAQAIGQREHEPGLVFDEQYAFGRAVRHARSGSSAPVGACRVGGQRFVERVAGCAA